MTNYKKILVSAAASAIIVGSLHASTLTIHDDNATQNAIGAAMAQPIEKADSYFKNSDANITVLDGSGSTALDAENATVKQIVYTPSVEINEDAVVTIEVTNGSIYGDNFYITKADGTTVMNFSTTGSVKNSANTGYSKLNFVALQNISANTDLVVSTASGSIVEPAIVGNKGLTSGSEVTIKVSKAIYQNGYDITNATTDANVTAKITTGYEVTADKIPATSIVSVETGRKEFKDEGLTTYGGTTDNTNDTNKSTSQSPVIIVKQLDASLSVNKVNLTVQTAGDCSAVTGVKVYPKGSTTALAATVDGNSSSCVWKFSENNTGGTLFSANGFEIAIDVNNSAVIAAPLTWTATLDVNDTTAGLQTLMNNVVTHKWTLDGAQFVVPYLNTNLAYGTYVLMTNTSAKDAGVTIEVYADKGANEGMSQATRICSDKEITLTTLPANSTRIYLPTEINDAIEAKCAGFKAGNQRYMGKFTVEAATGTVVPTAFQRDAATGGKRAVPVYKATTIGTDKTGWRE